MRILIVHNAYLHRGGEDVAIEQEAELLRSGGHEVDELVLDNAILHQQGTLGRLRMVVGHEFSVRRLEAVIDRFRPDILHLHNWMPLIGSDVYAVARRKRLPLVQTFHNYRISCLNGLQFRNGKLCSRCADGNFWPGIAYGCYRQSHLQSAVGALITQRVRTALRRREAAALIALTERQRDRLAESLQLPPTLFHIKPNFVPDVAPEMKPLCESSLGRGFVYVGRLSYEKGVDVLLRGMSRMKVPPILKIVGDGPARAELMKLSEGLPVEFLGVIPRARALEAMATAKAVVVPSRCLEGLPMVVPEALALGVPVMASAGTGAADAAGNAGWSVAMGDAQAWATALLMVDTLNGQHLEAYRETARRRYESYYTADVNLQALQEIYSAAAGAFNETEEVL